MLRRYAPRNDTSAGVSLRAERSNLGGASRSGLQWRVVARINRLGKEPFLFIGPELADIRIGLDRRIDQLPILLLATADINVADDIAEMIEVERTARRIRQ